MASKKTTGGEGTTKAKTECPITKDEFLAKATAIVVEINGEKKLATPKEFASGSFGYFFNDKVVAVIDGKPVKLQSNCILTVVGSKPA